MTVKRNQYNMQYTHPLEPKTVVIFTDRCI